MHLQPPVSRQKAVLADVGLLYAAAIWGATFFIIKDALTSIDPVVMVGYRFLLAGLLLLIYLLATGKEVHRGLKRAAFMSVILWLLHMPQTLGLKYTTASNSGFITGLFVAFVPLFSRLIFQRRPSSLEVLASGLALAGLWVLTGGLADINPGDLITLLAAMAYALHVLYSDKYMKARVDPFIFSCQQFLLVGLLSLLAAWIGGMPFTVRSVPAAWTVVYLALLPTLSAFVIQMLAQRTTPPLRVSLLFALQPVFAAVFAWTLGDEEMVWRRALGGLLIVAALVLSSLSQYYWRRDGRGANR
jgi:drug/metabolite transporter (DMT)-like permease